LTFILDVISLLQTIIALPEHWLQENVATLLFFAGDDITHQYLDEKLTGMSLELHFIETNSI